MGKSQAVKDATRVSVVSIIINLLLSLFKFIAGILGKSGAMISDAVHSSSDVFSTFIVIAGVNIAGKKSDKTHQYGHDKLECIAGLLLAGVLFATGVGIGIDGINKIIHSGEIVTPGILPLVAAAVSIVVKEWMFWYTRSAAKRINSSALMADAWHHRSDALSSVGSLIGIAGARLGLPVLDPIASIVICLLIIKAAYDISHDSIEKLVDRSVDEETSNRITATAMAVDGVRGVDLVMTRLFGSKFYVDIEISVDGGQTLYEAHHIAQIVHDSIEKEFPNAKHCMVHMNPYKEESEKAAIGENDTKKEIV